MLKEKKRIKIKLKRETDKSPGLPRKSKEKSRKVSKKAKQKRSLEAQGYLPTIELEKEPQEDPEKFDMSKEQQEILMNIR